MKLTAKTGDTVVLPRPQEAAICEDKGAQSAPYVNPEPAPGKSIDAAEGETALPDGPKKRRNKT